MWRKDILIKSSQCSAPSYKSMIEPFQYSHSNWLILIWFMSLSGQQCDILGCENENKNKPKHFKHPAYRIDWIVSFNSVRDKHGKPCKKHSQFLCQFLLQTESSSQQICNNSCWWFDGLFEENPGICPCLLPLLLLFHTFPYTVSYVLFLWIKLCTYHKDP